MRWNSATKSGHVSCTDSFRLETMWWEHALRRQWCIHEDDDGRQRLLHCFQKLLSSWKDERERPWKWKRWQTNKFHRWILLSKSWTPKQNWTDRRKKYFRRKSNLEVLIWVNARTDEVQNWRQITANGTVVLTENQNNETSESSADLVAKSVTLIAERLRARTLANSKEKLVHFSCSREKRQLGDKACRNTQTRCSIIMDRKHRDFSKKTARTWSKDWHCIRFLESSPVKQRKIWSLLATRIKHDRSDVTAEDSWTFSPRRTNVHQSNSRSLRWTSG